MKLRPPPITRHLWLGLGFVFTAVGLVGTVLPLLPGTGFLVLAAWCFSRSSPKFEAWLLNLPLAGQLIRDYRDGLGMPLRAKIVACLSILLAVSLSIGRIPVLVGQVTWVLIGLFGIWYIIWRVPLRRVP
ncbi:DUF454 domain-containing protein [Deinococcus psychrotolerans]|uniref:DUF454 domain-containing protein n=1 Tax=Deinococcus psychrotolerans TaxID=2489213 RepID=A0A3G8Y7L8_9DEIO|nr:YbaN family protein [Deinococcus psychrotolerans]AZI41372.1 DUF454 domain-containing protein [Deinococcus psychrotolerans]